MIGCVACQSGQPAGALSQLNLRVMDFGSVSHGNRPRIASWTNAQIRQFQGNCHFVMFGFALVPGVLE
jgi:hypothetical protein